MSQVDYVSINRNTALSVPQKAALKKVFLSGEVAANCGNSNLCNVTNIHRAIGGVFSMDESSDIQSLFREIRIAIDTNNNSHNIDSVIGSFRMCGDKKRVIRVMANSIITLITA